MTGKIGVFFTDIRDRILPFLRRQETLTVSNKSYHAELRRTLGDFRAKLVSTLAVIEELSRKGQETIQGRSFREILGKLIIPVDEVGYTTIRSYASDLGFAYQRKYSTHRNREERTYTITREA